MMKKYILISIVSILAAGCSFLEVERIGKATTDTFFREFEGLQMAGEGVHRLMLNFYDDNLLEYAEAAGDLVEVNLTNVHEGLKLCFDYELNASHDATYPTNIWQSGYKIITNANNILKYGPALKNDFPQRKAEIDKFLAWGYFARAMGHFHLCNCYAQHYRYTPTASHLGVVVMDHIPGFDEPIKRTTVRRTYEQIISDVKAAAALLEGKEIDVYHASWLACQAFLARIYLYMQDWDEAARYAAIVMEKKQLSPASEYVDMFRKAVATTGTETIFRLNQYAAGSHINGIYDPTKTNDLYPDAEFVDTFDDDDIRKTLLTYIPEPEESDAVQGNTWSACCKMLYFKSIKEENAQVVNPFVFRLSEMYLIHAEGLCKGTAHDLAGAAEDIKALRARAYGKTPADITLTYSTQADMEAIIETERKKELCFEGHRIFDIKRCGADLVHSASNSSKAKTITYPDNRFCLPIGYLELRANPNMEQNDGYDKNYN